MTSREKVICIEWQTIDGQPAMVTFLSSGRVIVEKVDLP